MSPGVGLDVLEMRKLVFLRSRTLDRPARSLLSIATTLSPPPNRL
jgi:hypothetical protein